ncbi:MAG TPA: NADH-quinone oxidoreductase subunit L [Desulfomonilaceae bacterium]|nr:NADH-quinone oxidoreductase subunit L [Desulfomonilaceae bacterium]
MFEVLWLIPAMPLAGFFVLAVAGSRLPRAGVAFIGVGSVAISSAVALWIGGNFIWWPPQEQAVTQTLWTWMDVASFSPRLGLRLDALSTVMVLVVTFVGFLIHLYSSQYMIDDAGYARFFAYMNLFMASMLILVLADNLLFLYLGWEGVGLCSYLLIGFWYEDPTNARAAVKAFIVTRTGDTAFAIGLFLLFNTFGTLQIQDVMTRASQQWAAGSATATFAAALLLGGALGKSAQLPLQTWLPDAMAGPTPVSALIHAATMVTAGVYLIARTHVLFELAPAVQGAVAIIGAATLLVAGFSALVQSDLKRALAYSTISQIGYMFLALGVGAWSAALFHFANHAFFKALLFLTAGVVIQSAHHEQNMLKLGGLRKQLPLAFWVFLIGASALSSFPLVTNGFYSKDQIIWYAWSSPLGNSWLWAAGLLGAIVTAVYSFRMVFLTFFGTAKTHTAHRPSQIMSIPLVVLAVLSVVSGFVQVPHWLGNTRCFSAFIETALPSIGEGPVVAELVSTVIVALGTVLGICLAYVFFGGKWPYADAIAESARGAALHRFLFAGWGFDWMYGMLIVRPFFWITRVNRDDIVDLVFDAVAGMVEVMHHVLSWTQTGRLRGYAMGIALGAVLTIAILVFV